MQRSANLESTAPRDGTHKRAAKSRAADRSLLDRPVDEILEVADEEALSLGRHAQEADGILLVEPKELGASDLGADKVVEYLLPAVLADAA